MNAFTCEAVGFAKAATPDEIEALADKLEPALAKAIREVLREHVTRVPLDDLAEAIKAGETWRVLDIVGSLDAVKAANVKAALENTVWAGGALAAQGLDLIEARFAFNRLNPELIRWLENYSLNLIRDIEAGTREAVRAALLDGMRAGRNPIDQARQIKQIVGLSARDARAVASYRKELETFHLKRSAKSWGLGNERSRLSGVEVMPRDAKGKPTDGIAQRRLRDMRYDGKLQRAMEERKPLKPEEIDKQVERYQERAIQNRARTIARSESIRATNVGVYEAWRQAAATGKVEGSRTYKIWRVSRDERSCFPAGVPVATPQGETPIEELRPGDQVLTSGGVRAVIGTLKRKWKGSLTVFVLGDGRALACTPDHRVWDGADWREAKDFAAGDVVHTIGDQPANIARIVDLSLRDANDLPTACAEEVVFARISLRVAMPEGAVSLYGDTIKNQCEVDAVASDGIFLNSRCAEQFEGLTDLCFEPGLCVASPITSDRAVPTVSARDDAELYLAGETLADHRRPPASFGAIAPVIFVGEGFSAALALNILGVGQPAGSRADLEAVHRRSKSSERLAAHQALFGDSRKAGEFAGLGAVEAALVTAFRSECASTPGASLFNADDAVGVVASGGTIDASGFCPLNFDRIFAAASTLVGEGQGINLRAICQELACEKTLDVFDIEVEEDHEFFANGIRVHNCRICRAIPGANPKIGVPLEAFFRSPHGLPLKLPPAHPQCRCSTFIRVLEPQQLQDAA